MPVGVADVVDGDDVRVLELGRDLGLALEAVEQLVEAGPGRGQALEPDGLDRDHAAEDLVLGLVDRAEGARPELLDDLVASRDLGRLGRRGPLVLQLIRSPRPSSSSGRPAEAPAAEEMEVDVVDAVARVVAAVEDEAEAALCRGPAPGPGLWPGAPASPTRASSSGPRSSEARDVLLAGSRRTWVGRLGLDVVEGEDGLVLVDHPRRDPPSHDLAEEAGHRGPRVYTVTGFAGASTPPGRAPRGSSRMLRAFWPKSHVPIRDFERTLT